MKNLSGGGSSHPDQPESYSRLIVILSDRRFSRAADLPHRSAPATSNGILQAMATTAQETVSGLGSTPWFWSGKTVTMEPDGYKNGYTRKISGITKGSKLH